MSFRCDVCGREVNGITMINGMNFCAKCYKENFIGLNKTITEQDLGNHICFECTDCKQKDQRIAELESEVEQLKANQNKVAIEKLGELENWINQPYTKGDCYYLNRGATIETTDLQQKIKELKGEK